MLAWLLETFRKSFIVHLIVAVAGCRPKMNGKKLLTTYLFLPIWFFLIKYLNNAVSSLYIRLYIDWLIKYIWLIGLFNACDTKEASMHIQPTIRSQHIVFSSGNRRNEWDIHVKFLFSPTCQQYIGEFYYLWMECTLFTPPQLTHVHMIWILCFQFKLTFARKVNQNYASVYGVRDLPIDICKYFKGLGRSNFMYLITDHLKNYTNLLHPCPFSVRLKIGY